MRTDRLDNEWHYTYNERGQPLTVTTPDGGVTTYTYSPGEQSAIRNLRSEITITYTYDDAGRDVSIFGQL